MLFAAGAPAQKVTFSLSNISVGSNMLVADVYATVATGQTWAIGCTNLRFNYYVKNTPGAMTFVPESPVSNANVNISNNSNYWDMTSTSILNDTAASLNIQLRLDQMPYSLISGNSLWLGTIKFNYTAPVDSCGVITFASNSAVFDNSTPLAYGTGWTFIDPPPCPWIGIANNASNIPVKYNLSQNYPNPFNPTTTIEFSIPKSGLVKLNVFDMLGRRVAELVNTQKPAGNYRVDFNASELSSGIYFYRLEVNNFIAIKKLAFIK